MSFRFETILRMNKNKEDLLQRDMGQINAMIQKQKDSQHFMREFTENIKDELNQKKRQDVDVNTMILYDNFFRGTQVHKTRQDKIISEITLKLEVKRAEVVEAMRNRKTLEILKDRNILKERELRAKKDLAIQDENASNLWGRKGI
ncbi:MAG TPA: flagellar export protein FliJ [Nitrospinae bacterium]|nr:flagellar export protein FliJ [Nitrospinota bacterium]